MDGKRVIGVDLGGTKILAGLVDRDGQVEQRREHPTPITSQDDLLAGLDDPNVRYMDLWIGWFDHTAHHNNDRDSHLQALREIDALLGRIWTAIEKSPLASQTALVLVSDHGFNTDERVISQGFNLVKLLGSSAGGGHHVATKRRLLMNYSLKGVYPFTPNRCGNGAVTGFLLTGTRPARPSWLPSSMTAASMWHGWVTAGLTC